MSTSKDRPDPSRQSLTDDQKQFLVVLQRLRYGRVARLRVSNGQPVLEGGVPCTRTVKVLGANGPHPASWSPDFLLRREITEFFRLLAELGEGEVLNLEVRNGLPFAFELNEVLGG